MTNHRKRSNPGSSARLASRTIALAEDISRLRAREVDPVQAAYLNHIRQTNLDVAEVLGLSSSRARAYKTTVDNFSEKKHSTDFETQSSERDKRVARSDSEDDRRRPGFDYKGRKYREESSRNRRSYHTYSDRRSYAETSQDKPDKEVLKGRPDLDQKPKRIFTEAQKEKRKLKKKAKRQSVRALGQTDKVESDPIAVETPVELPSQTVSQNQELMDIDYNEQIVWSD
ncbi:hypothetical protein TWF730_005879 [Orbilia blumenaviensis]|uniref:Uncharacterized protein n=1 Tax=Orbilia blumenaviensis TaxID=1796055 RepID=A0AAV9VKT4_9PEZI